MLYTKDDYGNVYNIQKNGSSYLSEQTADNMAYRLVKDKNGVVSYVLPTQIQDVEISADNKTGKTANGVPVYSNDGGTSLYKFGDDGKIYKVEQHSVTHEYVTKEEVASSYKLADGTLKYVWNSDSFTDLGTSVTPGVGEVFETGYTFYKVGDEFYAEKDGVVYKTISTPTYTDTPNGTYSTVGSALNPNDPTDPFDTSIISGSLGIFSEEGYELYNGTDSRIYAYDQTNNIYYLAQENTSPALTSTTYNADTANVAYYAVTEQGDTTDTVKYIEPNKLFEKDSSFVDMQVTTGGVAVYYNKDKDEYYAVDENNDIYLVDTTTDPNRWIFDPNNPKYIVYSDGQSARVYIENGQTLMPQEDLDFSTPYSVEKEVQQYKPYTIVYDQNNGKFVSCGIDNLAEGSSLSLKLSDILINHKINDDAENEADKSTSIYLSEDGFTQSNFSNIEIDFTKSMNYNNSGTSTMKALKGDTQGDGTGKKLGALTGLTVDNSGKIYGSYDNGNTVLLCQIACAQFANASGLEKVGENCYATTLNSGEFDGIGVEVDADGSSISTGELEMSNVDLSAEFTSMIITQRGFQANSRIITTSDTLLEELINLKR
ncbi:MAG: flagellar hook-basal body complex protein [Agathobacter sp.]